MPTPRKMSAKTICRLRHNEVRGVHLVGGFNRFIHRRLIGGVNNRRRQVVRRRNCVHHHKDIILRENAGAALRSIVRRFLHVSFLGGIHAFCYSFMVSWVAELLVLPHGPLDGAAHVGLNRQPIDSGRVDFISLNHSAPPIPSAT